MDLAIEGLSFDGFDVVNFFDELEYFADPILQSAWTFANIWIGVRVKVVHVGFPRLILELVAAFFADSARVDLRFLLGRIPQKVSHQNLISQKISGIVFLVWSMI